MITVWMLVAISQGGFSMTPIDTEINCLIAVSSVAITISEAYCYEMEQIVPHEPGSAPEMAPIAPQRPKRGQPI